MLTNIIHKMYMFMFMSTTTIYVDNNHGMHVVYVLCLYVFNYKFLEIHTMRLAVRDGDDDKKC